METINIYISLKEAENLIFNRSLFFSKNRIEIKRAKGLMSITFEVEKDKLIEFKNNYVVLFSTVLSIEIPEKEQNLFLNHYRLPLGLLKFNSRSVRDDNEDRLIFDEQIIEYNSKKYLQLRNGLITILENAYSQINNTDFVSSAEKVLKGFTNLSEFKQKLLFDLLEQSKFPLLTVKVDRFVTDNFYRVTWWGKFIVDNYVIKFDNKTQDEIDTIKKWLRGFLQFENIEQINQQLTNIPEELKEEVDFMIGYLIASAYFESFQSDKSFLNKLIREIQHTNKSTLISWIVFFKSLFDENVMYLYFVKSLNNEIFKIEKLAFELSNNNFQKITENTIEFNFNEIKKEELISEFLSLRFGGSNHSPQLINSNKAKNIFANNFSEENLRTNGFELISEYQNNKSFLNTCWFTGKNFQLNINSEVNISDIVYFVNEDSRANNILKTLKIKVKPYSKIIDKNKKVLLGFIDFEKKPNLLSIYSKLILGLFKTQFDKIIIVLLVDIETEKIQSLEFDNYCKERENEFKRMFNNKIELIIKSVSNNNDTEIKRNLKNVLKNYKMEQIEVIDENFDENKAIWILESNSEYVINNENEQYHSFLNIDC